jgi:hypothetical protein
MKHGMTSESARRARLTGNELKSHFFDTYTDEHRELLEKITLVSPLKNNQARTIVVKSGNNYQFKLGKIFEIESRVKDYVNGGKIIIFNENTEIESIILSTDFLKSYAFKETLFVARKQHNWQIFHSADIIELIQSKCSIRILSTGRIKFDFNHYDTTIKGIMTIEYRPESHKRSFVFGAHGGNSGEKFRDLLAEYLLFTEVPI